MQVKLEDVIRTLRKHGEVEMADALNKGELTIPFVLDEDEYAKDADGNLLDFDDEVVEKTQSDWAIDLLVTNGTPVDDLDNDMILKIPVISED